MARRNLGKRAVEKHVAAGIKAGVFDRVSGGHKGHTAAYAAVLPDRSNGERFLRPSGDQTFTLWCPKSLHMPSQGRTTCSPQYLQRTRSRWSRRAQDGRHATTTTRLFRHPHGSESLSFAARPKGAPAEGGTHPPGRRLQTRLQPDPARLVSARSQADHGTAAGRHAQSAEREPDSHPKGPRSRK